MLENGFVHSLKQWCLCGVVFSSHFGLEGIIVGTFLGTRWRFSSGKAWPPFDETIKWLAFFSPILYMSLNVKILSLFFFLSPPLKLFIQNIWSWCWMLTLAQETGGHSCKANPKKTWEVALPCCTVNEVFFEAHCPDSFEIWIKSQVYIDELQTLEMCLNFDVFHVFTGVKVVQGVYKSRNTLWSKRE